MAWIMTSFGILMPAIRPPQTVEKGDDRTLQIRCRREQELTILRAQYMPRTLGPTIHTPKFDYEYRAYCTPESFALAMARLITEIDYLKFKPTVKDRYHDDELYQTYNAIWSVVSHRLSDWSQQERYWHSPAEPAHVRDLIGADGWDERHWTRYGWDDYAGKADPTTEPATDDHTDLYAQIDALLDEGEKPLDHTDCAHALTNNARRRCLRARRAAREARLDALYDQIAGDEPPTAITS